MIAVVFPGQGSQKPGMGRSLVENFAEADAVFTRVSDSVEVEMRVLCFESDEDTLRQTQNAQLALYTCGVAAWHVLSARVPALAPTFAGHSVGEYAALAAAGVLSVEDGAWLVRRRGDLMARAGNLRAGTMAAVLGLEREALERVCEEASMRGEVAVLANDNCPGQLVISGDVSAVVRAGDYATAAGAKRVLPLNVSGAFHSPLMADSASAMGEALREVEFRAGAAVVANVTAASVTDPALWPGLLERQLKSTVLWTDSMVGLRARGMDLLVECGGGEVLCGLAKRIDREIRSTSVQDAESLAATVAMLEGTV